MNTNSLVTGGGPAVDVEFRGVATLLDGDRDVGTEVDEDAPAGAEGRGAVADGPLAR